LSQVKNLSFLAVFAGMSAAQATTLQLVPPAPRYQEMVVARIILDPLDFAVIYGATTEMSSNIITINYYRFPELSNASHDVMLGQLPAGEFSIQLRNAISGTIEATATFTVGPAAIPNRAQGSVFPSANFSGQWWSPAEPGWGLAITQGPTNVVWAEWYVYDALGRATWYTLEPGEWTLAETTSLYSGIVAKYAGSEVGTAYVGPPTRTVVGTGELSFRDAFNGTLNFVVDGVRVIKPISRLPIE
jgi:hypothetical protein